MKRSLFQAAVVSILLYGCTTWTLTKRLEKKLDRNYTRMLRAILNKSWRQHPTRHLPPITKTIQVRRTRHAGHYWRSKDELISDVLLWTPTYGRAKTGRPARTYIQQLCKDKGCNFEDLPEAMNDREKWRERARDIHAGGTSWWSWWLLQIFKTMKISEFRVLIKLCFLMGKNTVQVQQWLDKCYSDTASSETMVKKWYADFKHGHTDPQDAERSGRSNSAVVSENTERLPEKGRPFNSEYYIALLLRLKKEIAQRNGHKEEKVLFQQDNAQCHKSIATISKLYELHFEWLPQPPYSPDLTPSDY